MATNAASTTCPSCHAPVEPGERFCGNCGAAIPETRTCAKCGARLSATARFCGACGTPVAHAPAAPPPAPAAPAVYAAPAPPPTQVAPPHYEPLPRYEPPPPVYQPPPIYQPDQRPPAAPPPLPVSPYPHTGPASRPAARKSPLPAVLLILGILVLLCVAAVLLANRFAQSAVDDLVKRVSGTTATPKATAIAGLSAVFDNSHGKLEDYATGANAPAAFTIDTAWRVTEIQTTHWNNGKGATPGAIGLEAADGARYGPWPATGIAAHGAKTGDVSNALWVVKLDLDLPSGAYTILDSDSESWSRDAAGDAGIARVMGVRADAP